jgi:thiaminase/transcriptional activator TenA
MLRDDLWELGEPVLRKVNAHPFWSGLRDGSLPDGVLTYFVEQDTGYLLPTFGRALARSASIAVDDRHADLLIQCAGATLGSAGRLRAAFDELGPKMDQPARAENPPVDPAVQAHCAFFTATTATSLPAAIGGVLPMVWFNLHLSNELATAVDSRYQPWIDAYDSGAGFERAVEQVLVMVDEIGAGCSPADRDRLIDQFTLGARYEFAFAELVVRRDNWPSR